MRSQSSLVGCTSKEDTGALQYTARMKVPAFLATELLLC